MARSRSRPNRSRLYSPAILLACLAASVLFGLDTFPRLAAAGSSRGDLPLVVYAGRVPPAYAARRGPEVPLARPQSDEAG